MTSIIVFAILSGLMLALLIFQIIIFIKTKKKSKVLASVTPVFYVFGEVVSSIAFGCVFGVLLIANVVLLIFNILAFKQNKCKKLTSEKVKKEKKETEQSEVENKTKKDDAVENKKISEKKTVKTDTKKTTNKKTVSKKKPQ